MVFQLKPKSVPKNLPKNLPVRRRSARSALGAIRKLKCEAIDRIADSVYNDHIVLYGKYSIGGGKYSKD